MALISESPSTIQTVFIATAHRQPVFLEGLSLLFYFLSALSQFGAEAYWQLQVLTALKYIRLFTILGI